MILHLYAPEKLASVEIELTASKSESNRLLIIHSLCPEHFEIHNLAKAKDTESMLHYLHKIKFTDKREELVIDVGPAGTTMRFLTSLLAGREGNFILTGSERMKERPLGILVDALNHLGAEITYLDKENFPPLKINGRKLKGGKVNMDPGVSSQFVSSILLCAPTWEKGVEITFSSEPVSRPYLQMTIELMRHFGANINWNGNNILVEHGKYKPVEFFVEADWSAASYWYSLVALSQNAEVFLGGLRKNSLQGDSVLASLYDSLGVETEFRDNGILIRKKKEILLPESFSFDFESCPDIAQTVACTCAGLNIRAELKGLKTLRIKETDRIEALRKELKKFRHEVIIEGDDSCTILPRTELIKASPVIETYHDHRMAMAFAPLVLVFSEMKIEDPDVVQKSYPDFWNDIQQSGITLEGKLS